MNAIIFITTINESQIVKNWTFNIDQCAFLIDNIPSGFEFGKIETKGLSLLFFVLGLFMKFKSQNDTLQNVSISTENSSN